MFWKLMLMAIAFPFWFVFAGLWIVFDWIATVLESGARWIEDNIFLI